LGGEEEIYWFVIQDAKKNQVLVKTVEKRRGKGRQGMRAEKQFCVFPRFEKARNHPTYKGKNPIYNRGGGGRKVGAMKLKKKGA